MAKKKAKKKQIAKKAASRRTAPAKSGGATLKEALAWLERRGTRKGLADMERYGITAKRAFGVGVGATKAYGKELGRDHDLALRLWKSGWYEARLLAAFVDEPERVTTGQMDAWAADFDSWAVVDSVCFHLFDRTPHAWRKARQWAKARPEFQKRAAFALVWGLTVHDKEATDEPFLAFLPLLERAANDDRDYVKKAVDMALRATGKRNAALHAAAVETAERLAAADDASARWIGKHSLRELTSPAVRKRAARASPAPRRKP